MNDLHAAIDRVHKFLDVSERLEGKGLSILTRNDAPLYEEDLRAILSALKERGVLGEWRDIDDEARKAGLVLVMTKQGELFTAYWDTYQGGTWWIAGTSLAIIPRKWCRLPQPPREEG